jgi:hypothetical protein
MRVPRRSGAPVALLLVVVLLAACGTQGEEGDPQAGDGPPSTLTGVVTDIDSAGIDDIRSFTLLSGGESHEIFIADDVDYGFNLGHLQEHRTTSEPVIVELEERDGSLYARSVEDV